MKPRNFLCLLVLAALSTGTLFAQLTISTNALANGTVGVAYSQPLVATGGNGNYSWSIIQGTLPPQLVLSAAGLISGMPTTVGAYPLTIQVSSQLIGVPGVITATKQFTLVVTAPPLTITTTGIPNGTAGLAYSANLAATGGVLPYNWSVVQGSLPGGLKLDAAGILSGTPTAAGTFTFVAQVQDAQPVITNRTFSITILTTFTIATNSPLPSGTVGVAYSQTLAAVGGYGNYSWALVEGSLPSGLTLAATGVISGTPTALGSYTFIVQASSPLLNSTAVLTTTKQFTLLVVAPALLITTAATPNGLVGVAYSASLAATGGVLPYNWSVVQGSLPGGLTLGGNGALSGTPTAAGTFTFVAQVQDAQPVSATRTFSIIILAAVKIATTSSLPSGTVGSTYSQQLTATGGTPPYTWTASNGSLPPGLNVDPSSGLLWGTPTGAGTFSFAVTATDQGGNSDTATFTLTVVPALAITTAAALPNGTAGAPYAAQLAATGGTPPYTWIVLAELGALPSGVTVDASTGRLSGTPATGGSYSFSVRVTDSAKVTATKAFTLTVTDALTILTKSPLTSGTAGSAYQQQLSATGGRPPYTWSVSAGALPAGLALNASTGMVAGTPTAGGTFDVTIAVSDSLQTVTAPYQLTIGVPAAPTLAITGLPDTGTPATQPTLSIALSDKYPLDITGQATMTFTPDSGGDDPAVQFTTGGRTASFRVPVGTMQAAFSSSTIGVQTGTVAGTITVTARILAAGADITPTPAPTRIIRIAKSSPVIISASLSRTSSGFDLVVTGYSTPREVVSAAVGLKARPDAALSASQFTIALSGVFNTWYQSAASAPYGSQFSLRIPFTVQNVSDAVASVTVFLTNSQGGSAEKSVSF